MKESRNKRSRPGWLLVALPVCLILVVIWGLSRERTQLPQVSQTSSILFSEICTKNETVIADNQENYRDYIELYNSGADINLAGYSLTDGRRESAPFGDLIVPEGGYCLLFIDKELTGFSLGAAGGDCIQLISPDGTIAAQVITQPLEEDQVMLWSETGYTISREATPGFSNDKAGLQAFRTGTESDDLPLKISEVLTENATACPDERGEFGDVVELHNTGSIPVNLGQYCLSDTPEARFRYRLPNVMLEPNGYILIFCDGDNYLGENGEIHANFALSKGDVLCLTAADGRYAACPVQFPGEDVSLALDGEGNYKNASVSLGYANDENGIECYVNSRMDETAPLVINEVLLSASQVPYLGESTDVVEIFNRSNQVVSTAGWYLSDGEDPYSYPLPAAKLQPGESMVIPCSREETGFALSQRDVLCLYTPQFRWASRVCCGETAEGQSIIRTENGLYTTGAVSLGYANTPEGVQQFEAGRQPEGLRISELMSANYSYLKGSYGKTSDWVELYNGGDTAVQLKEYAFGESLEELGAYPLPDIVLEPGAYCVIFLSDKMETYQAGRQYLPFNLASEGAGLYLTHGEELTDYVIIPQLPTDAAYGRAADSYGFGVLQKGTPGEKNTAGAELTAAPVAATAQGTYELEGVLEVVLSGNGTIYYTTDCTKPTTASTPYTGPIMLTETTVIRAIACEEGKLPSQAVDLTYVINEGHGLPVVSLVTAPADLWDYYTGIYMEGPGADPVFPHPGANYWQPWEKAATVSLFETDGGGFSSPCGLAIFGAYSRALSIKPFSCFFRDTYGAGELNYPLFGEEGLNSYESFVLRCGGQDFLKARVRDVLMTSLVGEQTNVAVQKYRPVVLYLNGEFWGVYFIREKISENYVAGNYNVLPEDVTLCEANGSDSPEYMALRAYVKSHDLSQQEHYDYVCSQIDVENYIDYILAEIYVANSDNGNIKFFKTTEGKWTWILYDTDYGFADADSNTFLTHLNPGGTGHANAFSTVLINGLLRNPDFKEQFLRRLAWQMDNIWTEENVNARLDELQALMGADMKKDQDRWFRHAGSWEYHMDLLRTYVAARNRNMVQFARDYFGLTADQMRDYGFHI